MGGYSSCSRPFRKEKKNKRKKKQLVPHAGGQISKKRDKTDKSQAECFFCKKLGYWKRNYPQYIASLDPNRPRKKKQAVAQSNYMITPCNFFICDTMIWVLDTESPINICNSLQGLQITESFEEGERFLNVGDGRSVLVLALGIVKLVFDSHIIVLDDYHYCPIFLLNIISVGLLAKSYEILIKKKIMISCVMVLLYFQDI